MALEQENTMDVVQALVEISKELFRISIQPDDLFASCKKIGELAFMVNWIAQALDHEFELAAVRGFQKLEGA